MCVGLPGSTRNNVVLGCHSRHAITLIMTRAPVRPIEHPVGAFVTACFDSGCSLAILGKGPSRRGLRRYIGVGIVYAFTHNAVVCRALTPTRQRMNKVVGVQDNPRN